MRNLLRQGKWRAVALIFLLLLTATSASEAAKKKNSSREENPTKKSVNSATLPSSTSPVFAAPPPISSGMPPVVAISPITAGNNATLVVNGITQTAFKSGVLACTSRINQVSNFLTTGSQGAGAFLFIPSTEQDQRLVSFSLEIPQANGHAAYASSSFAPNQANGCGGVYEKIDYWAYSCGKVAQENFGTLRQTGVLSRNVLVLDGGPMIRIFLMPAGSGCISIKKELVL